MDKKTFIIRDEKVLARLIAFIEAQPKEPLIEVVVKEHHKDRNLIQNGLYWVWVTYIANELGLTKEAVHYDLKHRMLCPIYQRDDGEYLSMIQSVIKLKTMGMRIEFEIIRKKIIEMTSTTTATVRQFAEYLREIERDMADKGIYLPHKEDEYHEALMLR